MQDLSECSDGLTEPSSVTNVVEGTIEGSLRDSQRAITQRDELKVRLVHVNMRMAGCASVDSSLHVSGSCCTIGGTKYHAGCMRVLKLYHRGHAVLKHQSVGGTWSVPGA